MGFNSAFKVLNIAQPVRSDRPRPTTLLPPRSNGKPEVATAVYKLLMVGMKMPETCWAVFKRRAINLRDWCIWLVDLFECMMMHGLTNPKPFLQFEDVRTANTSVWNSPYLQNTWRKIYKIYFQNFEFFNLTKTMYRNFVYGCLKLCFWRSYVRC